MLKELKFDQEQNIWQGKISGELDVFAAPKLQENILHALNEQPGGMHLDCTGLTYVDSMGLGALVKMNKQIQSACGGSLVLFNLCPRVKKLFAITGLLKTFGIEEE